MTDFFDFDLVEERREHSEQLAYDDYWSTSPANDYWTPDEEEER